MGTISPVYFNAFQTNTLQKEVGHHHICTSVIVHTMTDIKRVGDSGVYTQEGNVAGGKAARLTQEREKQRLQYEDQKNKVKALNSTDVTRITEKFNSASDTAEQDFRKRTVGLVTAEEFRKAREEGEKQMKLDAEQAAEDQQRRQTEDLKQRNEERERKRRKISSTLSFGQDDDEEEEMIIRPRGKKSLKDPTVDTSFLPDVDREHELAKKREELKQEWLEAQERVKNEVRTVAPPPTLTIIGALFNHLQHVHI